jgi:hypothetical protein
MGLGPVLLPQHHREVSVLVTSLRSYRLGTLFLAVSTATMACSTESDPTGEENVEVQVSSWYFH